jgi:hypothetical protein
MDRFKLRESVIDRQIRFYRLGGRDK